MRTMRALAVVLLLVLGLSACGSDDGGSVTSGASGSSSGSTASSGSDPYGAGATGSGATGGGAAVDIEGFAFSPEALEVQAGQEVTITNDDSTEHTFTLDDGSYDSGHLAAGSKATHTFDTAGSYSYHCEIHSSMKGTVTVG
jgi:plastocyanin